MAPVALSACRMPIDAEELWISAVTTAPTSTPSTGLDRVANISANCGSSPSGLSVSVMMFMPENNTPKPSRMLPTFLVFLEAANINSAMPITAAMGASEVGLSSRIRILVSCKSPRRMIWEVIVVPMLAPMITPTACRSLRIPALTRPTTMTVVAEELWTAAVMAAPNRMLRKMLFVSFCRIFSILEPESRSSPAPIVDIP